MWIFGLLIVLLRFASVPDLLLMLPIQLWYHLHLVEVD